MRRSIVGLVADAPAHEPTFLLQVLGTPTIRGHRDPPSVSLVTQPLQLAALSWLALARPRGLQAREALAALLWPEYDAARSRRALRNAIHGLRSRLGRDAILTAGDHLIGLNTGIVACDAHGLERGAWDPGSGDVQPLLGLEVDASARFEEWATAERMRLAALVAHAESARPRELPATRNAPVNRGGEAAIMCARGHYLFLRAVHGGEFAELQRAKAWFERALVVDPGHAQAVAGLSNFYAVAARRGWIAPFTDTFGVAIALSERTLRLDPAQAAPHVHFGVKALYVDDDWDRAGREFKAAVAVEPSYAEGHRFLGVWLGLAGMRDEAIGAMEAAARLEPDIPQVLTSLAAAQLAGGLRDAAEHTLRSALAVDHRAAAARNRLVRLLEDAMRCEEAVAERMRAPAHPSAATFAEAYATGGARGYQDALEAELRAAVIGLEARVRGETLQTVDDIFAPPVLALVDTLQRLGDLRRAKAWRLQAQAARPLLARRFAALDPTPTPAESRHPR